MRRLSILLAGLAPALLLPAAGMAAGTTNVTLECSPGPWGHVRYAPLQVSPPMDAVRDFIAETQEVRWFVMIADKDEATRWLTGEGLAQPVAADLMARAQPTLDHRGWILRPSDQVILGLAPDVRSRYYAALGQWQENPRHRSPFRLVDHATSGWRDLSRLVPEEMKRFESLCYKRGTMKVFTDLPLMLLMLGDDQEAKSKFLRAITSESTYLATLRVLPTDDIEELIHYWGAGGRQDIVRPLIEAAAHTGGELDVPIPLLLPGFPRQVLYTYPEPGDLRFLDCHFSSINFFNKEADLRMLQGLYRDTFFNAFYEEVASAARLGDIIVLINARQEVIHSCVQVAGGLVFTKNGGQRTLPWMLMTLDDLLEYFATEGDLTTKVYRRKVDEGD